MPVENRLEIIFHPNKNILERKRLPYLPAFSLITLSVYGNSQDYSLFPHLSGINSTLPYDDVRLFLIPERQLIRLASVHLVLYSDSPRFMLNSLQPFNSIFLKPALYLIEDSI